VSVASLPLALRIALRDLRGGLRGFGIFLACIALGVAAIVAVSSVSRGLSDGLAREGRRILGGDVAFVLIHRELKPDERAFLESRGALTSVASMRAMARRQDGKAALTEIKAVPAAYPSIGEIVLAPAIPLGEALKERSGIPGFVAEAALAARLDLKIGDTINIGDARLEYRAELVSEPDKLGGGVGFGPRVIMSREAFQTAGLDQPGALVRWSNRLSVTSGPDSAPVGDGAIARLIDDAKARFPEAGWEIRTRTNVSPQFEKNLERFTQFLVLVGLTALVVGGVGVANAARAFVDRKTADLATFKAIGATGGYVFLIALTEIMVIAAIGIAIGLTVGAMAPYLAAGGIKSLAPFPFDASVYPRELAAGALYGMLTALAFSLGPLGRSHDVPVSALFRSRIDPNAEMPRFRYLAMLATTAALLIASIIALSTDRKLAAIYIGATLAGFVMLRFVATLIMSIARRLPRFRGVEVRMAVANIHRPGALTPSVVLSLGLGLALLVTLTLIDGNLRDQLQRTIPGQTPSFFFLDLRNSEAPAFDDFLKKQAPEVKVERVPMMRGRIVRLNGQRPEDVKASEDAAWVLEGDRGITYASALPEGSKLTEGEWWTPDYSGPALVSVEGGIAKGLGLKIGDDITVNVLGRNISAKIANFRTVNWRSLGINFVFVFSPNTFAGAPHTFLATATFPKGGDTSGELALLKNVSTAFPTVTSVRVKDALDALNDIMAQLTLAIRAASGIALASSILVLAGAIAAGQQTKMYEGVILKTLGATRGRLLRTLLYEYGILGLATAVFGVAAGSLAAWAILTKVMKVDDFLWVWPSAMVAIFVALVLTVGFGLAGAWRVLGQKPAAYLREL
jgi:putative ABC transport system permease protein